MAFGNEIRTGSSGQSTGFYNNIVRQSMRFSSADSTYLYKTPSSGNQKVFTWAAWVKKLTNGVQRGIWSVGNNAQFSLFFKQFSTILCLHKQLILSSKFTS